MEATAGDALPSPAPFPPSPSDSEPVAELLSEGECEGDFFPCFSSFFLFFFFFLARLCFLDFASPVSEMQKQQLINTSKGIHSFTLRNCYLPEIPSFLPSSFSPGLSPVPAAAANLALKL